MTYKCDIIHIIILNLQGGTCAMLEFIHFSKTYPGGKKAVEDLTLNIEQGDIYGFIGHNVRKDHLF